MTRLERYVRFWDERESPEALALVRITFGSALFAEALEPVLSGTLIERYAGSRWGGVFAAHAGGPLSLFRFVQPTAGAVGALDGVLLFAALMFTIGWFPRAAMTVALIVHATFANQLDVFGFSSDAVYRALFFPMALASTGARYSVEAKLGRGASDVAKWPRRLLIAQITIIYVRTGIIKVGPMWSSAAHFSALYDAVNMPGLARFPGVWAAYLYPLTQLGTISAKAFEATFYLVPLQLFLSRTPGKGNRLRRALASPWLRWGFLAVGLFFHATLILTMNLGFFSIVMLSVYPALLEPEEARRFFAFAEEILGGVARRWKRAEPESRLAAGAPASRPPPAEGSGEG